jgi:hypothetical protein
MNQRHFASVVFGTCFLLGACDGELPESSDEPAGPAVVIEAELAQVAWGGELHVHKRRICGFTLDHPVALDGRGSVIVACPSSPAPVAGQPALKAGIFVEPAASGSVISGFRFEGRGAVDGRRGALTFGVFSRGAERVVVQHNRVDGTVQAVTSTGGRGWLITDNEVKDLEVFGCPGSCGGGDGIVLAHSRTSAASADDAFITGNTIRALRPPADLPFSVTGVLGYAVQSPFILENVITLPGSPTIGIELTRTAGGILIDAPCGNARIVDNRVRRADLAIDVSADCATGTIVERNRGPHEAQLLLAAEPLAPRPLGLE